MNMEYSKDIILRINYPRKEKSVQACAKEKKITNLWKKHKVIATISTICGILIVLDCILVYNFIELLQVLA